MKNFIQFIIKYHIFFLFLILQIFAGILIVRNNTFQHSGFINSSNKLVGTLFTWKSNLTQYIELKKVNDKLALENQELRNKLRSNFVNVNEHFVMINDTLRERKYRFKVAEVINNSTNKQLNYLTLNKGKREGIQPEMGVINEKGLVGIIKNVSEHFSTAIPVINVNYTASAELKRTGDFGLLEWDGDDYRYTYLNDVAKHVNVAIGDTIVTREASAVYPRGILIGVVAEVEDEPGSSYFKIKVALANDFSQIRYVQLVENFLKDEQRIIEEITEDNAQ